MSLLFNMLSRLVITFLPRGKRLLIFNSDLKIHFKSAFLRRSDVQLSHPYITTGETIALTRRNFFWQSNVSAFEYAICVGHNFPSKE